MRLMIYYFISFICGLVTPASAGIGAEYAMRALHPSAVPTGHATPLEFFVLFVGVALLCVFLFLVIDVFYARFFLPRKSPKTRHFLLNLLLYLLMCLGGWILSAQLADWMGL